MWLHACSASGVSSCSSVDPSFINVADVEYKPSELRGESTKKSEPFSCCASTGAFSASDCHILVKHPNQQQKQASYLSNAIL